MCKVGIFNQNVQSIKSKVQRLEIILTKLDSDIVLITEHWESTDQLTTIPIQGYNLCASFCRPLKKHGGVAIYTKSGLDVREANCARNASVCNVFECCGVELKKSNIVVLCVYRPPSNKIEETTLFLRKMEELLQYFLDNGKRVIIGGNFNTDFRVKSALCNAFHNVVNSYNMYITTTEPTRVTCFWSTRLDNIVVNNSSILLDKTEVLDTHLSDLN